MVKVTIEKAFGKVRSDRWGVMVYIDDGKGGVFKYMPTYEELEEMYVKLAQVEMLNKNLCKEVKNGKSK